MTRSRLYILLDAFESDMRAILTRYVLDHQDDEIALGASFASANLRRESDAIAEVTQPLVFYLDMREAYDILNRHREVLPTDVGRELKSNTPSMDLLVPIRNRIMHGRPLHSEDAETAVSICQRFTTRYWSSLQKTIARLISDPLWEPAFERHEAYSSKILHNLPLPEYDETGLIGRSEECQAIAKHLIRRREPMVTITGEGGIGKTAIALEVAYSLADNPDSPYECILWSSLKTERLTANGIEEITNAVRDMTGAARIIGSAIDSDFQGGTRALSEALEGIETLLVVDNLETVHASEVIELYEALPDTVTFLFTSRLGIGQFERRMPLGPLSDRDAISLFRGFVRARAIDRLAALSQDTVREIVSRLRNSPLAIRWYVLAVEAGQQPLPALTAQDDLIDFCVTSVYDAMSANARSVLSILFAVERSVTFDELAILAEIEIDDLRKSVQEITNGSLVRLERDGESPLVSRISLTEAAFSYLRRRKPPKRSVVDSVLAREQEFRKEAELRRIDEQERSLSPRVVRTRSKTDEPAAHILRRSLLFSKNGDLEKALIQIERARSLNPDYWEIDRVEGFILSSVGQVDQATTAYLSAFRKADDTGKAVVSYYLAGHLARKAHEPDRAILYAKTAHQHFDTPDTAQALGNYLIWIREFADGQSYLESALERAEGRSRLIALTSLVDSWRRWSEYLLDHERRVDDAAQKAMAGFRIGYLEICAGVHDSRLFGAVIENVKSYTRCISVTGFDASHLERQTLYMLRELKARPNLFQMSRATEYLPGCLRRLLRASNPLIRREADELIRYYQSTVPDDGTTNDNDGLQAGQVISWKGTYGFVANVQFPKGIFFPAAAVVNLIKRGEDVDLTGRSVHFKAGRELDGRPRSDWVELL
ncbi:NB-ARC domain-containing protein [Microtetraspora malaysiensis]|uniref:tetratricopeptide repeat protein n=1 Tax=Microtetraspora malaysiensis TaxID=161358 RepID=UPI003D8DF815